MSSMADELETFLRQTRKVMMNARDVYQDIDLEGLEAELYSGQNRPGFVHDVRSVLQRPDLYELSEAQRKIVLMISTSLAESLLLGEILVTGVVKMKIQKVVDLDVVNLIDEDVYHRREAGSMSVYWPLYIDAAAALGLGRRVVTASGNCRRFNDAFDAWDATRGKIIFGDPWHDLERRFEQGFTNIVEERARRIQERRPRGRMRRSFNSFAAKGESLLDAIRLWFPF